MDRYIDEQEMTQSNLSTIERVQNNKEIPSWLLTKQIPDNITFVISKIII